MARLELLSTHEPVMADFEGILKALESPNSNGILSFVLGFLFMIMVYNITMYNQHKSKIYLYYTIYIALIVASTLFYVSSDFFNLILNPVKPILFKFVAFFRWSYNSFYFLFAFSFVDLRSKSEKWFKVIIYPIYTLLILGTVIQVASLVADDPKLISNVFSRFFIPYIFIHSIIGYYVLFKIEARFKYYVIIGSLFLLISSIVGAAIYYLELLPKDNYLRDSIFYFGVVAENALFSLGLAHKQKFILEEKNRIILADKELRLNSIIETQEKERSRIAQDLHDGVLQQIGGVILQARSFINEKGMANNKEATELINNLVESNDELRNISHKMMPKSLSELGMVAAIEDMLNLSFPYAKIDHSFEHFNINQRLPERIELVVYRVSQELVNNILKHSKATKVDFQLFISGGNLVMIVEDNGIGISHEQQETGIGVMNIKNRIESLAGTVSYESGSDNGTLITIKIPVRKS